MPLTLSEQEKLQLGLGLARARRQRVEAQNSKLDQEITAKQPVSSNSNTIDDFKNGTGAFASPIMNDEQAAIEEQKKSQINTERNEAAKNAEFFKQESYIPNPIPTIVGLGKGVVNAIPGVIQTAQSAGQAIGETINDDLEYFGLRDKHPEADKAQNEEFKKRYDALEGLKFKPSNPAEEIAIPVGEIGAGVAVGGGAGARIAQSGGRILKGISRLGGESLGVATAAPNQDSLIVRDNGVLGFNVNPDENPGTAAIKHRLNLALDNMAMAAAVAPVIKGVDITKTFGHGIYRNLRDWKSLPAAEKQVASDTFEVFANLPPDATQAQYEQALSHTIDLLEKGGQKVYHVGDDIADKSINRDSVSVLTDALNPNDPKELAARTQLESMRASAKAGNAPKTTVALGQQQKHLDDTLQEVQEVRGGNQAIEQTKQNLQQSAREEAESLKMGVDNARQDLVEQESGLQNALRNDETFGQKIKDADNAGVKLNINKESLDKQEEILWKAQLQREADKKTRDTAYDAIPTNAMAKTDEWENAVKKADNFIPERLRPVLQNFDGSFKYLNNEVRPRLSEEITAAYQKNDVLTARKLRELRDNITHDQVTWLTEQGSNVAVQAARDANKANLEYVEKYNQGIGKELKINEAINRPKSQKIDFVEQGRPLIVNAIKDPNRRESIQQLSTILGPENEHLVGDVALAEAMKDVTAGKGVNIQKVTSDLQQMAAAFPEKQRQRIEGFLTDIRDRGATIEDLKKRIPEFEKVANEEVEKVYMKKFDGLFEKEFGEYRGVDNGYNAFRQMLNDKEGKSIGRIIEAAKRDPGDMAGLQAAWAKAAKEKLDQNSVDVVPFGEEFEKYGKQIFGEDNPAVNAILELRKEAEKIAGVQRMVSTQGFDVAGRQQKALRAMKSITTMLFGVLNPTAARINVITSNLAAEFNANKISHQAIDNILADNQLLKKYLMDLLEESKGRLSPAQKHLITRVGVNLGLYQIREQTDQNLQK